MSAAQDQARRERADDVVTAVLRGIQQVVSFPGRSQYAGGPSGVSACGLAAFNCARVILGRERGGCEGRELLSAMVQRTRVTHGRPPRRAGDPRRLPALVGLEPSRLGGDL
jgi:hypothetical protein